MGQIFPRLLELWGSLTPVRKGLLTASAVGMVAAALLMMSWAGRVDYVTLYTDLDSTDSGLIVEELRARGVPYEIDRSGATVRVPQSQVDELRVDFASKGLPEGGQVGFELFEGNAFTATDFVQRLNYQRGLQGELERTISTFPAVQRVRVHIVMPERSLFIDDEQPSTASVVLSLRAGRSLAQNEVDGIAHLVSGAVQGLEKKSITILDDHGTIIYDGAQLDSTSGIGLTTTQIALEQQYENQIEANVQSMLDRALGPAMSAVSVSASMNFDRIETERETFTSPENGTPRSTSSVTETYTTDTTEGAGQIPGALSNVPGANANLPATEPATGANGSGTAYQRSEVTSNFELDRTVTRQVETPGSVERLSVSLLLDETVSEELATSLAASVAAAAGVDSERGDAVVVTRVAFDRSTVDAARAAFEADASSEQLMGYVRMVLPIIVLLFGFIFVKMLLKSISKRAVRPFDIGYAGGSALVGAGAGGISAEIGDAGTVLRALPAPMEVRHSELERSIERMAHQNPEGIAEVVQAWMRED